MKTDKTSTEPRCYGFGAYVIDPRKRLLWRDHTLTPLTSKAFEILLVLVENRGHVVAKSDLLEHVWQQTAVEDNTLTRHISTLRKALQERPEDHQYILTVPGRGYQFVGDVIELQERPEALRRDVLPTPEVEVEESLDTAATATPGLPAASLDWLAGPASARSCCVRRRPARHPHGNAGPCDVPAATSRRGGDRAQPAAVHFPVRPPEKPDVVTGWPGGRLHLGQGG